LAADHLGSITALTSSTGGLVDRFSYDPWGKRRQAVTSPWLSILPGSHLIPASLANLTRGFTGHEHLDRVGLIHMNGRIYDPELGRFLSADPILQFPASTQGLDRYAYVLNNPVSLSDPSGHLVFGLAAAALGAWLGVKVHVALGILTAALGGYLETGSLKAAVFSAISATFSFGVGEIGAALAKAGWSSAFQLAAVATLHGLTQGILAVAQGGKFGSGFLSAAASSVFGPKNDGTARLDGKQRLIRVVKAAAVGGTASRIGGGKFANGAVTGAFVQAFNELQHPGKATGEQQEIDGIRVYRKDIDLGGDDKYGHWWIEIDGTESYGWWPKHGVDYKGTLFGVDGELNGQTTFGGTPTLDPHHGDRSVGVNEFRVYGDSSVSKALYVHQIRTFAASYNGGWSWPWGQNCHSFQDRLLKETGLTIRRAGQQ
jgi:RHS repeat-associated protein